MMWWHPVVATTQTWPLPCLRLVCRRRLQPGAGLCLGPVSELDQTHQAAVLALIGSVADRFDKLIRFGFNHGTSITSDSGQARPVRPCLAEGHSERAGEAEMAAGAEDVCAQASDQWQRAPA